MKRGHGEGGIDQRGDNSFRLRWRVDGRRYTKSFTGTLAEARRELRRILKSIDDGAHVAPDKTTLAAYLRQWLDSDTDLSPKTRERYRQLVEQQIIPHLGGATLQNLRPAQISEWHATLLRSGGATGKPLSACTVGLCHRVLHRALERALRLEIIARNVVHAVRPPKVKNVEIAILTADQIGDVLDRLSGHPLHPIAAVALGTGMRRGEICALAWGNVDLGKATVRIERSLEETAGGLRFKEPKTRHGIRTVSLPPSVIEALRGHRTRQMKIRVALGLGRLGPDDLVFSRIDGSPYPPDTLSRDWWQARDKLGLPRVRFHSLRHAHASALIAAGLDVVAVSRRLGHASPVVTLRTYAHHFATSDDRAAAAIEAVMSGRT